MLRSRSKASSMTLFTEQSSRVIIQRDSFRAKTIIFLKSVKYRITIIGFNILSITQFILLLFMMSNSYFLEYSGEWIIYALIINTIFLFDLIAHIAALGFKRLMVKNKEYLCEFMLQVAAQCITILYVIFE